MPEEFIRAFIAIELPETIKSALSSLQEKLKKQGKHTGWVKPQNIHLTLKFLGGIKVSSVSGISAALERSARNIPAFTASVSGLGTFPEKGFPRILWAGLKDSGGQLMALETEIERMMEKEGFRKEERKFLPHLTLARIRPGTDVEELKKDLRVKQDHFAGKDTSFCVNEISLIKSTLSSSGSVYETIFRAPLKTG